MYTIVCLVYFTIVLFSKISDGQVLQFGTCAENVQTMEYFDLTRFLGQWYEIERFPTWYENYGQCAYKRIEYCGRRIEFEHVYVRDGIQFVLHLNSTYIPGDEAVFAIQESNIDPIGIPLSVISTDYSNYAVVYGCKNSDELGLKFISAWILGRERNLSLEFRLQAYGELNAIPSANVAYLQKVEQREEKCKYHWTAHVQAINKYEDDLE